MMMYWCIDDVLVYWRCIGVWWCIGVSMMYWCIGALACWCVVCQFTASLFSFSTQVYIQFQRFILSHLPIINFINYTRHIGMASAPWVYYEISALPACNSLMTLSAWVQTFLMNIYRPFGNESTLRYEVVGREHDITAKLPNKNGKWDLRLIRTKVDVFGMQVLSWGMYRHSRSGHAGAVSLLHHWGEYIRRLWDGRELIHAHLCFWWTIRCRVSSFQTSSAFV